MHILLGFLFLMVPGPLKQVEQMNIQIHTDQQAIFREYSNDNFSQTLRVANNRIEIKTQSTDYLQLELNFRVVPDERYISKLSPELKKALATILKGSYTLKDYMVNISHFLRHNIRYSENKHSQDPQTVIENKRAHCVGFSNITRVFLKGIGVDARFTQGFYLKKQNGRVVPIPHKWIEIELANGFLYFYDPQYQKFSSNYVLVDDSVIFTKIKRFNIELIDYSKKIMN